MYIGYYESPVGLLRIEGNDEYITLIDTAEVKGKENLNSLVLECKKELFEYFEGERKEFSFPFKLEGTLFQEKVWEYLISIPYGKVVSYKAVAVGVGNQKGVRAVANAIGKNKLLVVVPCHRVIGSNGSLTGFRVGLDKKRYLLDLEFNGF